MITNPSVLETWRIDTRKNEVHYFADIPMMTNGTIGLIEHQVILWTVVVLQRIWKKSMLRKNLNNILWYQALSPQ